MKLSIIIVNYKTPKLTSECIQSIYNSDFSESFEVIVVDNNSKDDSLNLIKSGFPDIIAIQNDSNEGFGRANNLGLKKASGEYILFLNSDVILQKTTLTSCLIEIEKDSTIGVLGCVLADDFGKNQRVKFYFSGTFKSVLRKNLILDKLFKFKEKEIKAIIGAFMFIPKHVLDKTGGFAPDFFMYSEELELCDRIRGKGFKIVQTKNAKAIHKHGGSTKDKVWSNLQKRVSNQLYFRKKYGVLGFIWFHLLTFFNLVTNFFAMWLLDKKYRKDFYLSSKLYFRTYSYFFKLLFWDSKSSRVFLKVRV